MLEDYIRINEYDEQQRKQERAGRDPYSVVIADPYSPYATPTAVRATPSGFQGYNSNFGPTDSTTALPLVNRKGGGDLTPGLPYDDEDFDRKTFYTEGGDDDYYNNSGAGTPRGAHHFDEEQSIAPSGYAPSRPMFAAGNLGEKDTRRGEDSGGIVEEEIKTSATRKRWVALTWLFTWWIPSFCLSWCGGMKRRDVRMAWREKLLIKFVHFVGGLVVEDEN